MTASPAARRARIAALALGVLFLALSGCSEDSPVEPQPQPQPKYSPSSTPQNTLANMAKAYSTRDSTGYDSLFDAGYVGTSFDPDNMQLLTFTKADEAQHIAALAKTTGLLATLAFPPTVVRERDAGDPAGWATIRVQNIQLEIVDSNSGFEYQLSPNETMEFKFAPTAPSPGSPTDTTWHIVSWVELAGSGPTP